MNRKRFEANEGSTMNGKTIRTTCLTIILAALAFSQAGRVEAYAVDFHALMSGKAFRMVQSESAMLQWLGISEHDFFEFVDFDEIGAAGTPQQLVEQGGRDEDEPFLRVLTHFYDVHSKHGLFYATPAPDWALEEGLLNDFTLPDAKDHLYEALTAAERLHRREAWAQFFYTLGHVIHLVQDMAQPQHVRSDDHLVLTSGHSRYEVYTNLHGRRLINKGDYPMVKLPRYRDYFDDSGSSALGAGLAQFAGFNFVSKDTNLDSSYWRDVMAPPIPAPTEFGKAEVVSVGYTEVNVVTEETQELRRDIKVRYVSNRFTDGYTREIVTNPRLTAHSYFDFFTEETLVGEHFTLTEGNFESYAEILVPRAVAYSAGAMDHLLRGRMRIAPPDEGVYGIVDQAKMDDPDKGFTKIKLKLQNTTPDILVKGIHDTTRVKQEMTRGDVVLIAKYRRNGCYKRDLSGEPDSATATSGRLPSLCLLKEYLPEEDDISVSTMQPGLEIPSGSFLDMEFDFARDPIPIDARDILFQVVYRGELSDEDDAIVVATRDISEPTFLGALNMSDHVLIHGKYYTPEEVLDSAELVETVIREISTAHDRDSVERWARTENATSLKIHFGRSVSTAPIAERATLAPGAHIRLAVLLDQNVNAEFPTARGSYDAGLASKFLGQNFTSRSSVNYPTQLAKLIRTSPTATTPRYAPLSQFRGLRFEGMILLVKSIGHEQPTSEELLRLPPLDNLTLSEVVVDASFQ